MAIVHLFSVATHAAGNADGYTTAAIDTSGADLLVITLGQQLVFDGVITDSKGNTWHPRPLRQDSNNSTRLVYAFDAIAGTGHTFAVTGVDTFPDMIIDGFSGTRVSSDPFVDDSGAASGFTNTLQPGASTAVDDGSLFVVGATSNTGSTTINSGFTLGAHDANTDFGHARSTSFYKIGGAAGSENPTVTNGATGGLAVALAVFAPGGGPVDVALSTLDVALDFPSPTVASGAAVALSTLDVALDFPSLVVAGGSAVSLVSLALVLDFPTLTVSGGAGETADAVDLQFYSYTADDGTIWAVKLDKTWGDNPASGATPWVPGSPVISKRGIHRPRRIELQDLATARFTRRVVCSLTAEAWVTPAWSAAVPVRGAGGSVVMVKVRSTPELFRHGRAVRSLPEPQTL